MLNKYIGILLTILILVGSVPILSNVTTATSCVMLKSIDEEILESTTIFSGVVNKIKASGSKNRVYFDVINVYKESYFYGIDSETDEINLLTGKPDGLSVGIDFHVGESYLVYARDFNDVLDLTTNVCSWTKLLVNASDDITVLTSDDAIPKPIIIGVPDDYSNDWTVINNASITDNILNLDVQYLGGCNDASFELVTDGIFLESYPVQLRIELRHDSGTCSILPVPSTSLAFDLQPLKDLYQDAYGKSENEVIKINLVDYNGNGYNLEYELFCDDSNGKTIPKKEPERKNIFQVFLDFLKRIFS